MGHKVITRRNKNKPRNLRGLFFMLQAPYSTSAKWGRIRLKSRAPATKQKIAEPQKTPAMLPRSQNQTWSMKASR